MELPPASGLSVTFSWTGSSGARALRLPLGPALRVAAALAVCAACFKAGAWTARLEARAQAPQLLTRSGPVAKPLLAPTLEAVGAAAPGGPFGQQPDVITPLNVRDPSALVMGPAIDPPRPESNEPPKAHPRVIPQPRGDRPARELRL